MDTAVFTGLVAVGFTLALRALARLVRARKLLSSKPLGCNLCMAFWMSLAATHFHVGTLLTTKNQMVFLAAYGLSYTLLELAYRPELPELEES